MNHTNFITRFNRGSILLCAVSGNMCKLSEEVCEIQKCWRVCVIWQTCVSHWNI